MTVTSITEAQFQHKVIDLAQRCGWRIAHFRTARNSRGDYLTPVAADGKGWPDLAMVNPSRGRFMCVELKSKTGKLSPEQAEWGAWLVAAGIDWQVWRPSDWPVIVHTLTDGRAL